MEVSSESPSASIAALPKELLAVIIKSIHPYDTIFLRATSKGFSRLCKEFQPFPQFHVLDQNKCMAYLIENGSISCLDYVKNVLHFEWTSEQCFSAARCGQVEVLKHLRSNGCPIDNPSAIIECTKGTCNIDMIKYLHENGASWNQVDPTSKNQISIPNFGVFDRNNTVQTVTENMAFHGHLECLKYAVQNGCENKQLWYTPSIECLDFAINNGFLWGGGIGSLVLGTRSSMIPVKMNICEEAAHRGDLTILSYAHQKGAAFNNSASFAAREGHLQCLKYVVENSAMPLQRTPGNFGIKTIECLQYLLEKLDRETIDLKSHTIWSSAAASIDYLKFVHDVKIPVPSSRLESLLEKAAWSIETFNFMLNIVKVSNPTMILFGACAANGYLEALKLIDMCPAEISAASAKHAINQAIRSKIVAVLEFVWNYFPNKEEFSKHEWILLVSTSTPEILDFFTKKGMIWTSEHIKFAADGGNLANLAYLTRIGCQWSIEFRPIFATGHHMCIKYAQEHGCKKFLR